MKQRRQTWTRIVFLIISCLLLFVISGFVYEWIASKKDKSQYPPPGELVDAGGYRLHIRKLGNGSPTILLESGSGESSLSWRDIPEKLSSFATVVSYDRAGYAWSEEANTPRTGENIVRELHTALKNADIRPPYILVGHSLGGCTQDCTRRRTETKWQDWFWWMPGLRMTPDGQIRSMPRNGLRPIPPR